MKTNLKDWSKNSSVSTKIMMRPSTNSSTALFLFTLKVSKPRINYYLPNFVLIF